MRTYVSRGQWTVHRNVLMTSWSFRNHQIAYRLSRSDTGSSSMSDGLSRLHCNAYTGMRRNCACAARTHWCAERNDVNTNENSHGLITRPSHVPNTRLYRALVKYSILSIANTASDDVCNRVAMLNELLQCRDGMLCLTD